MTSPRQIMIPAKPQPEKVSPRAWGLFLVDGWFYRFISIDTFFYPQEAYLKKKILDDEDEDEDNVRVVTERQVDYVCPPGCTWHVSKCRAVTSSTKLYSYKGVVNSLEALQNAFPKVSVAELTATPINAALKPNEHWQPVKWGADYDRWVTENAHLPREGRQPPRITRTPRPEFSLAAARHGFEVLARRKPLPFLDDSRKD